jgi:hypothetical protein
MQQKMSNRNESYDEILLIWEKYLVKNETEFIILDEEHDESINL